MSIWSTIAALPRIVAQRFTFEPRFPAERRITYAPRTAAGIIITADNAPTVATVWACIRYLSQTVAMIPWEVMRPSADGGAPMKSHPLNGLLNVRPNPEWSPFQFRETLLHWALRWGNGYAEIERDPSTGRVIALWPIHPSRVTPLRDLETRRLYYRVYNGTNPHTDLDYLDMFHLRGFGEGPIGVNVVEYAAESIGWARAAQLFGAAFFGNGMNVSGVITSKRGLKQVVMDRVRAAYNKLYRGVRGEKVLFLDDGMDFKPIAIEPEKGQFIATNEYLVDEICRWFGVPPHKVAKLLRSTNNNIEYQSLEVITDSVMPWVIRFEQEADFKLFGQNRQSLYTRMNMTGLLRADVAARGVFYQLMRQLAVFSANDILRMEGMPVLSAKEGGNKRVIQSQYTTLDKIGDDAAPSSPSPGAAPVAPREDPEPDERGAKPPPPPSTARLVEDVIAFHRLRELEKVSAR